MRKDNQRPVTKLAKCAVCDLQFEWEKRNCPYCSTPNPAHEAPEVIDVQVQIPIEVWRALVRLAMKRNEQPSATVIEAIETMISESGKRRQT